MFADSDDAATYNPEVIARAVVCGLVGADNSSEGEWKLGWNHNKVGWWYSPNNINKYYYTSQNGWQEIDREWYIFDSRGYALQDSWYYDEKNNVWYYLDENCKMVRGSKDKPLWLCIDGECYAFNEYGQMYCDCVTPDGWRINENGVLID